MSEIIITFLLGVSPLAERGAIPFAYGVFHLPIWEAFAIVLAGNLFVIVPLLFFLFQGSEYVGKYFPPAQKFLNWLFSYTQRRHGAHFTKWHERTSSIKAFSPDFWIVFALFVFVAIPLPMTGPWSGSLAAFVFGIPPKRAALAIALGVIVADILLVLATLGVVQFIKV